MSPTSAARPLPLPSDAPPSPPCRATPNGELLYAEDPGKRVSEFTQQDINDKKILFRHKAATCSHTDHFRFTVHSY